MFWMLVVSVAMAVEGRVAGVIDAPVDEVVDVILDFDGASSWFPDLVESEAMPDGSFRARSDLPWPFADRYFCLRTDQVKSVDSDIVRIDFGYVDGSGNIADMSGYWEVSPESAGSRVEYFVDVDLGIPIPNVLLRWGTARVLPVVITGLEAALS